MLLVMLVLGLMMANAAGAANTVTKSGNFVTVVFDGSTDLDFATNATISLPNGCSLHSIMVRSNAANDVVKVRWGSATGTVIFDFKDILGGGGIKYFNGVWCKPYLKGSEVSPNVEVIFQVQ
jgi:hypothetical protein